MDKTLLTKREYLGEGYNLQFLNNQTQEIETFLCSKEEYEEATTIQPIKEGYSFVGGNGGFMLVNNPNGMLGINEFAIIDDTYYVSEIGGLGIPQIKTYSEEEFNNKYIWQ